MRNELDLVKYTLWRGGVLMGRVRVRFPTSSPDLLAGMLEIESAFSDVDEIMQSWPPFLGAPVFESRKSDARRGSGAVALRELTREDASGIPPARVLEVRDQRGQPVVTDLIGIDLLPDELMAQGELFDICVKREIPISRWSLVAHVRDGICGST